MFKNILLHGFSHNRKFFQPLTANLTKNTSYEFDAIDLPGRGNAPYYQNSKEYNYGNYIEYVKDYIKDEKINIIGTSMGGLIAILLAEKYPHQINKIILNDIGTFISKSAILNVGKFIGQDMTHPDLQAMTQRILREFSGSAISKDEADFLVNAYVIEKNNKYSLNYDAKIADAFWRNCRQKKIPDMDFTQNLENSINANPEIEIFLIRGENSQFFTQDHFLQLSNKQYVKGSLLVKNKAHPPLLNSRSEFEIIESWIS